MEDPNTKETLAGERITAAAFDKFQRAHSAGRIRKEIYDGEALKHQDQLYAALSSSSHPTVIRSLTPVSDSRASNFMRIINELAFPNLFLVINSQDRLLDDRARSESAEFMREALKDMDPKYRASGMCPNKDYRGNLAVAIESLS